MTEKPFNLKEFVEYIVVRRVACPESKELVLSVPKVKEFIRILKEQMPHEYRIIDKLSGGL